MATVLSDTRILSDELLQTFGERAPTYDRENRFFAEDFEDLRLAGYLELAVPTELGGRGLNLAQRWDMARKACVGQIPLRRGRKADRRPGDGSLGRHWHVQEQRARAALP